MEVSMAYIFTFPQIVVLIREETCFALSFRTARYIKSLVDSYSTALEMQRYNIYMTSGLGLKYGDPKTFGG